MLHTSFKAINYCQKAFFILLLINILSCKNDSAHQNNSVQKERKFPQLFETLDSNYTNIHFQNQILENVEYNFINFYYIYNGGGVGIGDINNDGKPDLYLASITGPNKMYLNKGDFKFEDITEKSGLIASSGIKTGITMVDINNDGYLDIYQCRSGRDPLKRSNHLFINNKDLTFTDRSKEYGLEDQCPSSAATFFDFDKDGDLDLYLLNHPLSFDNAAEVNVAPDAKGQLTRINEPTDLFESDRLYKNNGNGTFTDISKQAGIINRSYGLSVTINDFNNDTYPDIYIGNDFVEPDIVYINNKNGTFTDKINEYFRHTSMHTMGVDIADVNNDGYNDLVSLDMNAEDNYRRKTLMTTMTVDKQTLLQKFGYGRQFMRNNLQLNSGSNTIPYSEIGCLTGISNTDWSWCCFIQDFDNDGKSDIFINNGYPRDVSNLDYVHFTMDSIIKSSGNSINLSADQLEKYLKRMGVTKVHDYMYKNMGNLQFEDVSMDWGLGMPNISNGAAYGDLDGDGDLDLIVNNQSEPLGVFKNNATKIYSDNKYLQIEFIGNNKNKSGIGASARFKIGDDIYYKELIPNRGYASSVEQILHFGLGNVNEIPLLEIKWADGKIQSLKNVKTNQKLKVDYSNAILGKWIDMEKNIDQLVVENNQLGLNYYYRENEFSEFDREFLIPHKLSSLGPCIAVGDVNGDKLEDLYVGGANNNIGSLYFQTEEGMFKAVSQPGFQEDAMFEDVSALFFDADNDHDLDLLVVSGGNEYFKDSPNYNSRIYFNDGKGNFKMNFYSLLKVGYNGGVGAVNDFDSDGDLDVFIGCRSIAGKYPLAPNSYIFRNDGGKFVDVTTQVSTDFSKIGMISDMKFGDIDGDKKNELIVVGEWMPISILKFENGKYVNITQKLKLENTTGWWNCVQLADLDNDGDLDIIGGNEGLNTRLKVSESEPLEIYAKDFDNNGAIDPIITYYNLGKKWPLAQRDLITKQIPSLKKKTLYYRDYANARLEDLFSKSDLEASYHLDAKLFKTSWFENVNGTLVKHDLPIQSQFSPTYGITIFDINHDGYNDIVQVGNKWECEPETGQQDAGNGLILINEKNKNFKPILSKYSGFVAPQNARTIVQLHTNKQNLFVVGNNNASLQTFLIK